MSRTSLKNVSKLIKSMTDQLPPQESLLNDLRRSIELTDEHNKRKPSQSYKPSNMNCIRQSYYQLIGVEPDSSGSSYMLVGMAESGTDRHIRIQQYLLDMKKNGFDCEYVDVADFIKQRDIDYLQVREKSGMETKLFWPQLKLSFLADGIIKYKSHYYVVEIKTETSRKWFTRDGVDPSHYHQAICYGLAFGLDNVIFIYENRDTCDKKIYLFTVTDEMKQQVLGYISNCDNYVKQESIPPIPLDVQKKTCEYCIYKNRCRGDR